MRLFPSLTLFLYIAYRFENPPVWWSELLLYNLVLLVLIVSIILARVPDDRWGRRGFCLALFFWGVGSVTSSIDSFFPTEMTVFSETFYSLFYPFALFGLIRALRHQEKSHALELIDTLVIALSGTTLLSTFALKPAGTEIIGSEFEVFLAILYPIGDLVLLFTVLSIVLLQHLTYRNFFILLGVLTYTISDFYYLWASENYSYQFGSLTDTGWLVGFILIGLGFWFPTDEESRPKNFNPLAVTLALIASSLVLAISVLRPGYFPTFALIPAFATIALAFIRMTVATGDAKKMSDERILARTDELTGLANRRKFLTEYETFVKSAGSLLILDLDGFKPVNDRLGHEIGDQLLRQVAQRFTRVMPRTGLLARLGGDEFGALIPGGEGHEVAIAIRATLSYPFQIAGNEIKLSVSIGEALSEPDNQQVNLLRRADEAMYLAKRAKTGIATWRDSIRS